MAWADSRPISYQAGPLAIRLLLLSGLNKVNGGASPYMRAGQVVFVSRVLINTLRGRHR